jgi:asparagine synthase (glutamine-hydrolysing)
MSYRYAVLVGTTDQLGDVGEPMIEAGLHSLGMRASAAFGPIKLYASPGTPVHVLPNGGFVIGHLFSRNGTSLGKTAEIGKLATDTPACRHILDTCWGDYLLVEPTFDDARSWKVTRDPSGGMPCVYSLRDGIGFFTSHISLATRLGRYEPKVDWDYIADCLVYTHKTSRTGLAGVRELLPGCSLHAQGGEAGTKMEWNPWSFVVPERRYIDPNEAARDVRRVVAGVVAAWAETDKSVLLELSGGLDSSILAACLKDAQAHIACCTLVTSVPGADERRYASLMSDKLRVPLEAVEMGFEDGCFDFPLPENSVVPGIGALQYATNVVKERVGERLGITSYMSGGGGDTVFCYLGNAAPAADAFRQLGLAGGVSAIRDLAELHQCTLWRAARLTLRKLRRPPKAPYQPDTTFLASSNATAVHEDHPWLAAPDHALDGDRDRIFDLVNTQLFKDGAARGAKRFLRYPLLSQPVVEACLAVPSWMWIARGRNRAVARSAFADALPQELVDRRSKGTYMNYSGTLYRKMKHRMLDYLLTGRLQAHGLLDAAELRRYIAAELPPRDRSFMRIFELCMVENWVRHQP